MYVHTVLAVNSYSAQVSRAMNHVTEYVLISQWCEATEE